MKGDSEHIARRLVWRSRFRKSVTGVHAGISLLLFGLLMLMINYLVFRNLPRRVDWSTQQLTVLAEQTERTLEELSREVRLIAYTGREYRARDLLDDLLAEYGRRSPLLGVEYVDPDRDLGPAKELRSRYDLTEGDQLLVVVGDQHEVISLEEMVVLESDETRPMGEAPRMVGFRGEGLITGALLRLLGDHTPVVYFLTGHGEKDIDDFENSVEAYSNVRERLESTNMEVRTLQLEITGGVPEDAGALVIAGPSNRIPQPELDLLREYLHRNGRLMVLLNPVVDGGLEPLLKEWGVQLVNDVVIDRGATLTGAEVYVSRFSEHPVTRNLRSVTVPFLRPRSVRPVAEDQDVGADRPRYTALAATTEQSWAKQDLTSPVLQYQPGVDVPGPIPIAAAVEKGPVEETRVPGESTRLVVIGDADFAANRPGGGGGLQLVQNSVNWLLDRDREITVPPKPVEEIRLQMDREGLNQLLFYTAVVMPGAAALLGILVAWRRRA